LPTSYGLKFLAIARKNCFARGVTPTSPGSYAYGANKSRGNAKSDQLLPLPPLKKLFMSPEFLLLPLGSRAKWMRYHLRQSDRCNVWST